METEKLEEIIETVDKKNPSPDYKLIGNHFKSISTMIGVYFVVNFILGLIPKVYPKGFWNENINVSEDKIYSIINNYSWLNLISSIFFFIMVFTTIVSFSVIGNEFINFNEIIEKKVLSKSNEVVINEQSFKLRTKKEKNDFLDYLAIIVAILVVVGLILLIVSSIISK